ncbi:hypothetical protein K9N68_30865 [Kovacikia minuta CCNUW1]|uniref:hypothetical protein n=1 Tax=Kovacikia minuta TaxID=2931930 RepID=UPI001CCA553A|nr:hypothetical protein [Kovacikia minuta]UBF25896.1 hypothetical protein K9N68_30865 [Kovacikia minuta CCNUW1]
MQSLKPLPPIQYSITQNEEGVTLCIWEPARITEVRVKPFLFKINHRLPSNDEARRVLSDYLENF